MGHVATKQELIAILRRFDMDGDAKINMAEFTLGMKSSLTVFAKKTAKRPKSSSVFGKLVTTGSNAKIGPGSSFGIRIRTPRNQRAASGRSSKSGVRSMRPRTSKGAQLKRTTLSSYSGSLMPRDSNH